MPSLAILCLIYGPECIHMSIIRLRVHSYVHYKAQNGGERWAKAHWAVLYLIYGPVWQSYAGFKGISCTLYKAQDGRHVRWKAHGGSGCLLPSIWPRGLSSALYKAKDGGKSRWKAHGGFLHPDKQEQFGRPMPNKGPWGFPIPSIWPRTVFITDEMPIGLCLTGHTADFDHPMPYILLCP